MKSINIPKSLRNQKNQIVIALVFLCVIVFLLTLYLGRSNNDQGHKHDEAQKVAAAREADKRNQNNISEWSKPKSNEELAKARELVGKVGNEQDSRFANTEECLAFISREKYINESRATYRNRKEKQVDYEAMRAACYQNPSVQ